MDGHVWVWLGFSLRVILRDGKWMVIPALFVIDLKQVVRLKRLVILKILWKVTHLKRLNESKVVI